MHTHGLRLICAIAATLALAGALTAPAAFADDNNLSAEVFGSLSSMRDPQVSPNGDQLAFLSFNDDGPFLVITNLEDRTGSRIATEGMKVRGLQWVGDQTLLLTVAETRTLFGYRGDYEVTRVVAVNTTGDADIRFIPRNGIYIGTNINMSAVTAIDWDNNRVLMAMSDPDWDRNLLSINLETGHAERLVHGSRTAGYWIADGDAKPVIRFDFDDESNHLRIRHFIDGEWEVVVNERTELPTMFPIGLLEETGELVVSARYTSVGFRGVYAMSTETGEVTRPLIESGSYDIETVITDPYTNYVLGAYINTTSLVTVWLDPYFQEQQSLLEASFPGMSVKIVSWSRDRDRLIVRVGNGSTAPVHYLFDVADRRIVAIGSAYPRLANEALGSREPFSYVARDGETIPGYLTLPTGRDPQNLPLILMPHGGPEARDNGGFHYRAHFLASRGYAVLQPNFRGSDGLGRSWRDAGRGTWGTGTMQHDLSDGVAALVESGMVDPDRVCIVGASYGGYAALAGAAFTPDLYACAAAIAPVSNVAAFLNERRDTYGRESTTVTSWVRQLGGEDNVGRERLRSLSPAVHAENVRVPVLLLHGRDDLVVPISQSNEMNNALNRAGGDVRIVRMPGEDHWLSTAETRIQVLTEIEAFLAEHLD